MNPYARVLGHPFVYDKIRPLVVGGIDVSHVYRALEVTSSDVVFDVGCGLGEALRHFQSFQKFIGIDVDPVAIRCAEERYAALGNVHFKCGYLEETDVAQYQPTCAVMSGVLHHVDDQTAVTILRTLRGSPRFTRMVTSDIVYLPGEFISNALAWLDRGRFCRRPAQYQELAAQAGFEVSSSEVVSCNPKGGLAKYFVMRLRPIDVQ